MRTDDRSSPVRTSVFSVDLLVETDIEAPVERAWEVLAETAAYPEWNPFITGFSGSIRSGEKLRVTLALPGRKPMTFTPTVKWVQAGRGFSWLGRALLPGIFDGEHRFVVESRGSHGCRMVQSEHFRGLAVPFARTMLTGATREGFEAMNLALKARAESRG